MSLTQLRARSYAVWLGATALALGHAQARAEDAAPAAMESAASRTPSGEANGGGAPNAAGSDAAPTQSAGPDRAPSLDPLSRSPLPPEAEPLPPSAGLAPAPDPIAPGAAATSEPDAAPDLAAAIPDALTALSGQTLVRSPIGAADWRAAVLAMRAFYAARQNAPVWVDARGLTSAARDALARLARADDDGLDLGMFALPAPATRETRADRLAAMDATISAAVIAYAMQASGVRAPPSAISALVTAKPEIADPGRALSTVAGSPSPSDALWAFNPPQKGYRDLRDEWARLRASATIAAIPPLRGPALTIGMADPRVPLIRARFSLGATADISADRTYDARVASAVAAFQKSRGLPANGVLTATTSDAIFDDPAARLEALILANMEMWRWQPRDMGERRVEINVPDYSLRLMDGDNELRRTRVIVGKPDTQTPIFSNEIKYILVNPAWHVPDSIIKKEMLPKLARDPDYLTKHGFEVTEVAGHLVVKQPPGEANALGRILFMFPNEHSVYLHDTPTRGLFSAPKRAFSHGCIRVEAPFQLAELALGGAGRGWSAARVESLIGSQERAIFLPRPLPIHIEYFTAFVDESDVLQQREDVYGLTARVAATLSRLRQD